MAQYTNSPVLPQAKISQHLDCSFDVGRDLVRLAHAMRRAGMASRGDYLAKMAERLLNSAADAMLEVGRGQ